MGWGYEMGWGWGWGGDMEWDGDADGDETREGDEDGASSQALPSPAPHPPGPKHCPWACALQLSMGSAWALLRALGAAVNPSSQGWCWVGAAGNAPGECAPEGGSR